MRILGLLVLLMAIVPSVHAELVFTAPPRESAEAAEKIYSPIAESLTQLLGEKVTFKRADNFISYSLAMRNDAYDIVFDGPHFAGWRINHLNHQVVAKLPGELDFHIVSTNPKYTSLKDLIGRRVCALISPNLGTVALLDLYRDNPTAGPKLVGSLGGFKGVMKDLERGHCEVGILRTQFYKKALTDEQRAGLTIIHTTKPVPNQVITVGPRVSKDNVSKISQALTAAEGFVAAQPVFNRFSKQSKSFVVSATGEYADMNKYLEGLVWGW